VLINKPGHLISYLKPSLERHKGCDLISVYPGAGLFTNALHDAVEPRSHLLLEPDETLYAPFLKPLLEKPNVKLVPKSGIIWQDLEEVLTPEYLPNQVEFNRLDLGKDPPRNDTLLVHMNLAMYPKRKYGLFDSVSRMVLYQLISSIRTSTRFQKYGQVRMLVWVPDEEKEVIVPRIVQNRKKGAIEAELATEYIAEVCGHDGQLDSEGVAVDRKNTRVRPHQLDLESVRQTMVRMREGGYVTPRDRGTRLLRQFKEMRKPLDTPLNLTSEPFSFDKSFQGELENMQREAEEGLIKKGTKAASRLSMLAHYSTWLDKMATRLLELTKEHDAIVEQYRQAEQAKADGDEARAQELRDEAKRLNDEYNSRVRKLPEYVKAQVKLLRDQLHVLRQPADLGPVLAWDRRPWEPLKVQPNEFFPNQPCALLDIQPKATHRLLRHIGPGTSNAGDIFDMILTHLGQNTLVPLVSTMDHIWPGARSGLEAEVKTVHDPAAGGSPLTGEAVFGARAANQVQLLELLEEFMRWPFMPSYPDLVGRLEDDGLVDDTTYGLDEEGPGSLNLGNTAGDSF
jgi:hypothetical protein